MRKMVHALILMCFACVTKAGGFELDTPEYKMRDMSLSESTGVLCKELGNDACSAIKEQCKGSPLLNACFQRTFLFSAIDFQVCGKERIFECINERVEYYDKIKEFAEKYASSPGFGRAAMNSCAPFYKVEPKTEKLKTISSSINSVTPSLGDYMENKGFFECIKDQYLKMARQKI